MVGNGRMTDYSSYASTPWGGLKHAAINEIQIKGEVTYIGASAFASPSIGNVVIKSQSLEEIGPNAFSGASISKTDLDSEVKKIGNSAYAGCSYLRESIGKNVEYVGEYAFSDCKSVNLNHASNLKEIGKYAFLGTPVEGWTPSEHLTVIGMGAFSYYMAKEVTLPKIKELNHSAFSGEKLSEIHIGPNLEKVTGTPFYGAASGNLYIERAKPIKLDRSIMDPEIVSKWTLHVPKGSESAYIMGSYWGEFKRIVGDLDGSGNEGSEENKDAAIVTVRAVPDIFGAKLYGSVKNVEKIDRLGFEVSLTSNFDNSINMSINKPASGEYVIDSRDAKEALEADTEYYYRAYAKVKDHVVYGSAKKFYTLESKCPEKLSYSLLGDSYDMVLVEGGPDGDFYIMQTELPHALDLKVNGESIDRLDRSGDGHVIATEFRYFINDLRAATGIEWRLPTPDEWKFAAKGGRQSKNTKYSGSNDLAQVGWYAGNSGKRVQDCAKKDPNELGLFDMSGNYAELTFGTNLYDVDGAFYGGSWKDASTLCTVTSYKSGIRTGNIPGTRLKEKNAFNGSYITVRLIYSKK